MGLVKSREALWEKGYKHHVAVDYNSFMYFNYCDNKVAKIIKTLETNNELVILDYWIDLHRPIKLGETIPDLAKALEETRKDCNDLVDKGCAYLRHKEIEA